MNNGGLLTMVGISEYSITPQNQQCNTDRLNWRFLLLLHSNKITVIMFYENNIKERVCMKQQRMTARQKKILSLLSGDNWYLEIGAQPYSAAEISYLLNEMGDNVNPNSVRTTLKLLAEKGLASVERKKTSVLTGLGNIERELDHYWNTETKEEDEKTAKQWEAGREQRSKEALDRMVGYISRPSVNPTFIDVN